MATAALDRPSDRRYGVPGVKSKMIVQAVYEPYVKVELRTVRHLHGPEYLHSEET